MDDLIKQGASAFKAGDRETARKLFSQAVKQFPDDERAWGWMVNICTTDVERIMCLKQMVRINPGNEKARSILLNLENPIADSENSSSPQNMPSEVSLTAQQSVPSLSPQQSISSELLQPPSMSKVLETEPLQTQFGELSLTNEKAIIDLLQKQNEILDNLRVIIRNSAEAKSEKEYRLRTRIVDVDMSISSMANLMFKWFIASIPVGIVLGFIFIVLSACFAGLLGR